MTRVRLLAAIGLLLASAPSAGAQSISMLNPMPAQYKLLGFVWAPPKGDGWREMGSQEDAVHVVYAEQLPDNQINTRADITLLAVLADDPAKVPDALTLTGLSQHQRLEEKKLETGTEVVAISRPNPLGGPLSPYEYELRLKVNGEEMFEDYFVALSPDKTQYLAAKLVTKDKEFRTQPYFQPLQDSIASLTFPSATSTPSQASAVGEQSKPADTAPAPPTATSK